MWAEKNPPLPSGVTQRAHSIPLRGRVESGPPSTIITFCPESSKTMMALDNGECD
jgi:hypothetical protein